MHKSRLGTIVIDCQTADIDAAAGFWSAALGRQATTPQGPNADRYRSLEGPPAEVTMLVQAVEHPSRVHMDIETDDIEAELARLEALGPGGWRRSRAGGSWKRPRGSDSASCGRSGRTSARTRTCGRRRLPERLEATAPAPTAAARTRGRTRG